MTPPLREHEQPNANAETLIVWLRGDVQKLGETVERLAGIVGNLEVRVAPVLNYIQPCQTVLDLMKKLDSRSDKINNWWSRLALELAKVGIVSLTTAVLVLWAAHYGGKP